MYFTATFSQSTAVGLVRFCITADFFEHRHGIVKFLEECPIICTQSGTKGSAGIYKDTFGLLQTERTG
jgi:hypothetical protein